MKTLIADVGSSSSKWVLINESGLIENRFELKAFNPYIHTEEDLQNLVEDVYKKQSATSIHKLYYYGTGIKSEIQSQQIASAFNGIKCEAYSDTLGSARSLCFFEKGIVCILGTGSNCCFYDGNTLSQKTQALGFPLGDEGSGNHIGRSIVRQYYYQNLPDDLHKAFKNKYQIGSASNFLSQLNDVDSKNAYLAQFSHFAKEHEAQPFINQLIQTCFQDFFDKHVSKYPSDIPLYCNGSIAIHYEAILRKVAKKNNRVIKNIQEDALQGLVSFHHSSHGF